MVPNRLICITLAHDTGHYTRVIHLRSREREENIYQYNIVYEGWENCVWFQRWYYNYYINIYYVCWSWGRKIGQRIQLIITKIIIKKMKES